MNRRQGAWIYVLHFDTPLAHAQHYVGCTATLRGRLERHATGNGSRLTRELFAQGIDWTLGGLFGCSLKQMRRLERGLKDQHNAHRYCGLCSRPQARFPDTTPYDTAICPFPIRSEQVRKSLSKPATPFCIRPVTIDEPETTIRAIINLMHKDKDALGFIPAGGHQGLSTLIPKKQLLIAEAQAGELLGYCFYTTSRVQANIHQCCVADAERFRGIGLNLVNTVAAQEQLDIVAKVREDLAANHFWKAIGFQHETTATHDTSGSLLNHYRLKRPHLLTQGA